MEKPSSTKGHKSPLILFFIVYGTMFIFGVVENIKGVSFPLIKMEFGINYESQGGLVSVTWMGYVLFCLLGSIFLERFGVKKSILAGYLLICIGAVATLLAPSFWIASLTLLIVNAGFGFFEVGNNALAMVVFTRRAALMMNLMHFFYGFGAILGPKTAGFLTQGFNFTWRGVYVAVAIPTAICFLLIILKKIKVDGENKIEEASSKVTFISAVKSPMVWMFSITLGFMEIVEFGAANWGGLYLQDVYGLDPRTIGANFVALFYLLFTLSRLTSGLVIERAGYMKSMFFASISVIVLFMAGFMLGRSGIWILPVTGLFTSVMWPTIMAIAMKVFDKDAPVMSAAIITISGAINGVFQFIIGLTNQYIGMAWGYRSCLFYAVCILIMLCMLYRKLRSLKVFIL